MQPVQILGAFLDYYAKWDSGDYQGAKRAAENLPDFPDFEQPSAVAVLGNHWFEISGNDFANRPSGFYGNEHWIKVYACDELARIWRLIHYNEDYRSAFLRAAGLNEIIMVARVVRLVSDPAERGKLLAALDNSTPPAYSVFEKLSQPPKTQLKMGTDRNGRVKFENFRTLIATFELPSPMQRWWVKTKTFNTPDGWDDFLEKRNKLAHEYFSVPREWAEDALRFVQANFEDFLDISIDHKDWADIKRELESLFQNLGNLRTTALPWSELCKKCGLSEFLPPRLR
uniref:Uncharacterized protein n=1 Tax=Ammonifex degensii TaxID=42838 RepID=A0A7C2INR6_9THEO